MGGHSHRRRFHAISYPHDNSMASRRRRKRIRRKNRRPKRILQLRTAILSGGRRPFRRALRRLDNAHTEIYGPVDDRCVRVHPADFKKVRVVIAANAQPKFYRPYKIAWLARHGRWPECTASTDAEPEIIRECSHLCGAKECFNVKHLI